MTHALGIVAADRAWLDARSAWMLGLLFVLGAAAVSRGSMRLACALVVSGAAGAASLGLRLETAERERPVQPQEAVVEGRVAHVNRLPGRVTVDLEGIADPWRELSLPRRARLYARMSDGVRGLAAVLPGDRLRLRVRLRAPRGRTNPGGGDPARRLARQGIAAVGAAVHPELVVRRVARAPEPGRWLHALRRRAGERLAVAGPGGELLRALALGDRAGLDPADREAFRRLGVSHLLVVSGLHLALAAALVFAAFRRLLVRIPGLATRSDPRRVALACAVVAALGYAALAGWGIPVRRAFVLLAALAAGVGARRRAHAPSALAAAALLILAVEPGALFDAGAQLSFAASGALLAAAQRSAAPDPLARRWLPRAAEQGVSASSVAIAATAPIAAWQIGAVSPWAPAANLVLVPWTGLVLLPVSLASTLAACLGLRGMPWDVALAAGAALAGATLRLVLAVAEHVPATMAPPPTPTTLGLAAALALATVHARCSRRRLAGALAIVALLALAPAARVEPDPPRAVFLDVGQGDATLVQGRRAAVLVDAGTALPGGPDLGRSVVVPALRALGVGRLDLLVLSHADLDHRGGALAVLRALPVRRVWIPHGGAGPAWEALRDAARARGVVIAERGAGSARLQVGDLGVTPLWPPVSAAQAGTENDRSLVVRIDVAGRRVLLPGDLEAAGERALAAYAGAALSADVLKLAHHGSRTSSRTHFLEAVGGTLAIASAPFQGRFGMPHEAVRERVRAAGYALGWTGRDGALLVGLGSKLDVRTWRGHRSPPRDRTKGFSIPSANFGSCSPWRTTSPARRARRTGSPEIIVWSRLDCAAGSAEARWSRFTAG